MSTDTALKIGDAAAVLGIGAHVLRHWESVGLLVAPRTAGGHRAYDEQMLDQARLIRRLQRTGLSLGQIRELAHSDRAERRALIQHKRAEIHARITLLQATDRFLAHVSDCSHPIIADCPDCSTFAAYQTTSGHDRDVLAADRPAVDADRVVAQHV